MAKFFYVRTSHAFGLAPPLNPGYATALIFKYNIDLSKYLPHLCILGSDL